MKKTLVLFSLLFSFILFGQSIGDYRSVASGDWQNRESWEYFNGSSWSTPTALEGYPGEFNNTLIALIQHGHTISIQDIGINTQPFDELTINGSLLLIGKNAEDVFFTIKSHRMIVTPNLDPLATIEFSGKGILQLPADGSLQVTPGGLIGDCTNNQSIYIGDFPYSVCKGGGSGATFDEVMDAGGTLNTLPSSNSPVLVGETIELTGEYIGPPGENLTFEWKVTDPLNNIITSTEQNLSIPNAIEGFYTATFSCFTTYSGIPYSNFETISVVVNRSTTINGPVATPGSGATCDQIIANWEATQGATTYFIDVATDLNFMNYVPGYENLEVGNVLSKQITGLTNGTTYFYRVYASNGTMQSPRSNTVSYATLTTPNGLIATVTAHPDCNSATGTVTLDSPYTNDNRYTYNVDGGPYSNTIVFSELIPGSHFFTIRFLAEDSCISNPAFATINQAPITPVADAGADFIKTCLNNPNGKQIGAPNIEGVRYLWSPDIGLSDPSISNPIANPTQTTTYTLTTTQTAGGCTATDSITITVSIDPPSSSAGEDFTKSCTAFPNGKNIGSEPLPATSYSWSPSAGLSNPAISNPVANPDSSTIYTLTALNNLSGCSNTDSVTVTVNTTPPLANAGSDFSKTCQLNPNGKAIGAEPLPFTTYQWSPATGLSDPSIANPIANPSQTTSYSLQTTNTLNGCIGVDTIMVIVDNTISQAEAGNPFTKTCIQFPNGKEIGSTSQAETSYSWSPATGLSDPLLSNPIANPSQTTTYTLTTTNNNTGCTSTDSVTVTVNNNVPLAVAGDDFNKTCAENPTGKTIGSSPLAATSYSWSPSTGLSDAKSSAPFANPTSTTLYTLTTTNTQNGCTAQDQINITVNTSIPPAKAGADFTKSCSTNPNGANIGEAPLAGLSYSWTPVTGLSDPNIANPFANPDQTTTYTLNTTDPLNGCSSKDSVGVTVNNQIPTASAGEDFIKSCLENTAGKTIGMTPQSGNTYRWTPSSGLSSATIANPIANPTTTTLYSLSVTSANGCTASDEITVSVNINTPAAGNAGPNKTTNCSVTSQSIGLPPEANTSYSWSPVSGLSDPSLANPIASPTTTTTYSLQSTNNLSGCTIVDEVIVTVNKTAPSAPIPTNTIQPSCDSPTASISLSGLPSGNWSLSTYKDDQFISSQDGFGNNITLSGLTAGSYYFIVTDALTACASTASPSIVINPQPPTPTAPQIGSITDPTCAEGGSVLLNNLPTVGTWTVQQSGTSSDLIQGSGSSTTINNLLPGRYQYKVISDRGCISPLSDIVTINQVTSEATLESVSHPNCDIPTGSIRIINLPTTGWTIIHKDPNGTIIQFTETEPSPDFFVAIGLIPGQHNFALDSGAICLAVGGKVTINEQPQTPEIPIVSILENPSCSNKETSIEISNLPPGNWTIDVFDQASSLVKTIYGNGNSYSTSAIFPPGDYSLSVTSEQGCTSEKSQSFTIIAEPLALATPIISQIIQPDCQTASGSILFEALPESGNWTLHQSGSSSAIYTGTGSSYTVSSLSEGNYFYIVSSTAHSCPSAPTEESVIDKAKTTPTAPIIGTINNPSCESASASIAISGLPQTSWILFATPAADDGSGLTGSGTTAFLSGILEGNYTVKVENADGCLSPDSESFTLLPQPITPPSPILSDPVQPNCNTATGSFTIENYDPTHIYTANPDTGIIISGNIVTATPGRYTLTATLGACTSIASESVEITAQPPTPTAPLITNVTHPSCTSSSGSISISGLPQGVWTLFATPPIGDSNGLAGSGTSAIYTGAIEGTYSLIVENEDNCLSPASLPFTVNPQPPTPPIPTTSNPVQPSCTLATGSFTITNYDPSYTYTIYPTQGASISGNTVTAVSGNYFLIASLAECSSQASARIEITAQPITPSEPIIENLSQPSCTSSNGSVAVKGLPQGPWIIFATPPISATAEGLQGIGSTTIYDSMPAGSYTLKVQNSAGCISQNSTSFVINTQPITPTAPLLSNPVQPNCDIALGSFTIENYDSSYSYQVIPSEGVNITENLITAPPGTYHVYATLAACTSPKSQSLTINPQPQTPTAPIIDYITHASCESNMGSIGISGLPESSWILTSSGGKTLAGVGPTAILTGNTVPGTYYVSVTNAVGCTSAPSENVILNPRPFIPAPPLVGSIIQPGCILETGTITISDPAQGTGYLYNIDGGNFQPSASFSGVPPGLHTLSYWSLLPNACPSLTTSVEIKEPLFVNAPLVKSSISPDCLNPGSISLEGLPAGNWTLYQSGTTEQTLTGSGKSTTVHNLEVGTYSYRVSDGTCISKSTPNVLLKPLESTSWTGTNWTNGLPDISKYIYMNGNYSFDIDTDMCRCEIITGFIQTRAGITIKVLDKLEILSSANFSFDNSSSLVQSNNVSNVGKINYNRLSSQLYLNDYTFWSSPVAFQQLGQASPNTAADRFFSFDAVANTWKNENPINHMKIGRGYSIGSPSGFNLTNSYNYPINFIGVPNNGNINTDLISGELSYLIGNPYPSAIDADQFLSLNKEVINGCIYFWSHNLQSQVLRNASNDYSVYNATGGVGISPKDPSTNINYSLPNGIITAAQSFFVQGKEGVSGLAAKFNNSLRLSGNNTQFFKNNKHTKTASIDRLWLNLYNSEGAFKQLLLGYSASASNGFDSAYDATAFNGHQFIDFYSINNDKKLVIQTRALPFDPNQTVALGYSSTVEGVFEINIDQSEGLLNGQPIYLEDKETTVFSDLKKAPYRFNTGKGTFDKRFVLHFTNQIASQEKLDQPVIVSLKEGIIKVNSFFEVIHKLELYDINGKLIKKLEDLNINEYFIDKLQYGQQVLIVKTYLKNNDTVATKIIYSP